MRSPWQGCSRGDTFIGAALAVALEDWSRAGSIRHIANLAFLIRGTVALPQTLAGVISAPRWDALLEIGMRRPAEPIFLVVSRTLCRAGSNTEHLGADLILSRVSAQHRQMLRACRRAHGVPGRGEKARPALVRLK